MSLPLNSQEIKIKEDLFNELMKHTGFSRLSMDAQGAVVNEFVRAVSELRKVEVKFEK